MAKVVHEALEEYRQKRSAKDAANIRSIIKRQLLSQLLSELGLQSLEHKPIPYILEQIPVNGFIAIADPIAQKQFLLIENPGTRKVKKSQWGSFCQWLQKQEWYSNELPHLSRGAEEPVSLFTHLPKESVYQASEAKKRGRHGLKKAELTPKLNQQLQDFHKFCQTISRDREQANRNTTQTNYQTRILLFLGWLKNLKNVSLVDLDLSMMSDLSLLRKYEQWNEQQGLSSHTIKGYLSICTPVCQFLFSKSFTGKKLERKLRPYRDLVSEIPDRKDRPYTSDEACKKRALSRQECETIVRYLQWRCKDLQQQWGVTNAVVDAWMDYLIIALLITTGVRQREVRELSRGRLTLTSSKIYYVNLNAEDHKTGSKTKKGRAYPLFLGPLQEQLSSDLTYYLNHIRPNNLDHDCLFFIRKASVREGSPGLRGDRILDASILGEKVPNLIYKVTAHLFGAENAKRTTCHDFRRITATWVCTYGEKKHLGIYAQMLGMSDKLLEGLYARINPQDMAEQVPKAFEEIAARQAMLTQGCAADGLEGSEPASETSLLLERVALALSMVKIALAHVPKSKRNDILEVFSPSQRRLLEI